MFNTLFTSLPVIFLGIFEKDLLPATLIAAPELYTRGQRGDGFNFKVFASWMFMGVCEAMVVYFTMFSLFANVAFTRDNTLFAMGDLTYTVCIIVIFAKLQVLETHNHSVTTAVAGVLSVGGWFLWNMILSRVYSDNVIYYVRDGFLQRFGRNLLWWAVVLLSVVAVLLFEIVVRTAKTAWKPTDVEIFQALEKDADVNRRFQESSVAWLHQGWQLDGEKAALRDAGGILGIVGGGGKDSAAANAATTVEEQQKREKEVGELLSRPRVMTHAAGDDGVIESGVSAAPLQEDKAQEMFNRGYGIVKRETMDGPQL